MGSAPESIAFFDEIKAHSLHKLGLLSGYLQPLTYKLGSTTGPGHRQRHIWIIDGFAGAGVYGPDASGKQHDGSPLIAAKWARGIAVRNDYPLVRCINVERDSACYARLRTELAAWQDLSSVRPGEFADHLPTILNEIGCDPALFFLDPFGVRGIEMRLIRQISERPGVTELILHFSDRTFLRMAGHLDDDDRRTPIDKKQAATKIAVLDEVIGTKRWQLLLRPDGDMEKGLDEVVALYLDQLRGVSWTFAHQIRIRDDRHDRAAYRLIFATRSAHGVEMMSHLACKYESGLESAASAGQLTLWHDDAVRQNETRLRDAIHSEGIRLGSATRQEIIHTLVPRFFGEYQRADYHKRFRELVDLGRIDRLTSKRMTDDEPLTFVIPTQESLSATSDEPA